MRSAQSPFLPDAAHVTAAPTTGLQASITTTGSLDRLQQTFTDPSPPPSLFSFMSAKHSDSKAARWLPVHFFRDHTPRSLRYRILAFSLAMTILVSSLFLSLLLSI